jgi:hypothetical protein
MERRNKGMMGKEVSIRIRTRYSNIPELQHSVFRSG